MLKFVKSKLKKAKSVITSALAVGAVFGYNTFASASGPANGVDAAVDSVKTQIGSIGTGALIVLGAVAVTGISLFAGIYIWRYGKKVFQIIAK